MANIIHNDALRCDGLLGMVKHTETTITAITLTLNLDKTTGIYLCDVLDKAKVIECPYLDRVQHEPLIDLGLQIAPHFGHRISEAKSRIHRVGQDCSVTIDFLTVEIRSDLAWALCIILAADLINSNVDFSEPQKKALIHLGAAIGALYGHSNAMIRVTKEG